MAKNSKASPKNRTSAANNAATEQPAMKEAESSTEFDRPVEGDHENKTKKPSMAIVGFAAGVLTVIFVFFALKGC